MDNTATSRFMNMTNLAERTDYGTSGNESSLTNSLFKALAIIVILMLLGINIFYYLGDAVDFTADILNPIYSLFGYETSDVVKQTVKTSAKGATTAVDLTADTAKTAIKFTENVVDDTLPSNNTTMAQSKRGTNSNTVNVSETKLNSRPSVSRDYVKASNEDDETLVIDSVTPNNSGSLGYCYIGEDRGHRSCAEVDDNSLCMSGEVFPSRNICVNPNLRD